MSFKKLDKKAKKQGNFVFSRDRDSVGGGKKPSEGYKTRLWELFSFVEQELDQLHAENSALRDRIEKLESVHAERQNSVDLLPEATPTLFSDMPVPAQPSSTNMSGNTPLRKIKMSGQTITKKLKTYTPSKKGRSGVTAECSQVCVYDGHRDGVWEVSHARNGLPVIGTASADGTACIWDIDSTNMLLRYSGHTGSVNSIAFHPRETIVCTGSGDNTMHIWSSNVNIPLRSSDKSKSVDSSGEDRYCSDEDLTELASETAHQSSPQAAVKQALLVLTAHKAPVMSCDWLSEGQKLVSASWDRTAKLWDFESAQVIHSLEGHDQELTHVCAHPTQQLLVTSSEDATFRLWDFRAPPIHSVNVFQGHSKAVNSAAFSSREYVVSGSDDHSIKIWDLRNMRAPVDSVRLDSGVNRISVSQDDRGILAVPLDNRHIKLYDLTGNRLAHLPRRNRQGHRRMVYSVAWSCDNHMTSERCNLFSSGFDNKVVGWKITV